MWFLFLFRGIYGFPYSTVMFFLEFVSKVSVIFPFLFCDLKKFSPGDLGTLNISFF